METKRDGNAEWLGRMFDSLTAPKQTTERTGRCICGGWVVDHFDADNRKLTCEQAAQAAKEKR